MRAGKKKLAAVLALAVLGGASSACAQEGYVYYPTEVSGATNIYTYDPDVQYELAAKVGYTTDLQLRPGETIQGIAAGNTSQWSVDTAQVAGVWHVYVKPLADQLTTNFLINTDQRTYRLIITSGDTAEYSVRWAYPKEDEADRLAALRSRTDMERAKAEKVKKAFAMANGINTNYKVVKNKNVIDVYLPQAVFDNGTKTYIELSEMNRQNFPTVYYYDEYDKDKLQLVNYRVKGRFLEIDKVMDQIKLQYSQKSFLLIERTDTDRDVPSPDEIELNKKDSLVLAVDVTNAASRQAETVEVDTNPVSLKTKARRAADNRRIRLMREAAKAQTAQDVDTMSQLLDAVAPEAAQDGGTGEKDAQADKENDRTTEGGDAQ